MNAKTDNQRMIAKIRALMAKTEDRGCTTEEAMAAAAKVAEIMGQYGLSAEIVEFGSDSCDQGEHIIADRHDPLLYCSSAIGHFCCVKPWVNTSSQYVQTKPKDLFDGGDATHEKRMVYKIVFFGLPHEVEIAAYLLSICRRVADNAPAELKDEMKVSNWGPQRFDQYGKQVKLEDLGGIHVRAQRKKVSPQDIASFRYGVCCAMAEQLMKLGDEHIEREGQKYHDRMAFVTQCLADVGIKLSNRMVSNRSYDTTTSRAGRSRGEKVRFNAGVRGGTKLIGKA